MIINIFQIISSYSCIYNNLDLRLSETITNGNPIRSSKEGTSIGMGCLVLILSLLLVALPLFASEKSLKTSTPLYTDDDLDKYKYPSDRNESSDDSNIQKNEAYSTGSKEIGQEHPTKGISPPEDKKRPYSNIRAILYKTSWWPQVRKVREYLQSLGVNLVEYDIEKDQSKKDEIIEKSGKKSVPFIDIEGIYITGADFQKIKQAVEKKRMQDQ